jgi:hypothetical protein
MTGLRRLNKNFLKLFLAEVFYSEILLYKKQTPWPLVRKQTIPTEGPPLVGEI